MKKYTLVLSVFILSLILIGSLGFNANSASAANCAPGELFSTTTGQSCNNANTNIGCLSGYAFSPVTGKPCTTYDLPPTPICPIVWREFKLGSRGDDVRTFQQSLKDEGFLDGKVDGVYGPITNGASLSYYRKCPKPIPSPNAPVISGVSGPQKLNVNEQGKWEVTAYDKNGGNLSYAVVWGDEMIYGYAASSSLPRSTQQSATFTHSYAQAGIFTPKFTVTNSSGQSASTSLSVNVGGAVSTDDNFYINPSSANIKVGGTATFQAMYNNCPKGAQCFVGPLPVQATWTSSNSSIVSILGYLSCVANVSCANTPIQVKGISEGTAIISASYTNGSGNVLTATALVTVNGTTANTTPKIISILPAGCTNNTGWSPTTGESCAGNRSSANFGDTVYLYGSGFGTDTYAVTYSTSTGAYIKMTSSFISSSLLSFIVPSSAGEGTHGIRIAKEGYGATSNAVSLNFLNVITNPAFVTVLSPNGGTYSRNQQISFQVQIKSQKNLGNITLSIVSNPSLTGWATGNHYYLTSSSGVSPSYVYSGSQGITDDVVSGKYYLMALWTSSDGSESATGFSNVPFNIVDGTTSSVTVLSPNGGENWVKGTTQTIIWQDNSTTPPCPAGTGCYKPAPKYFDITLEPYYAPCVSRICPMFAYRAPYTIANSVPSSSYNWSVGKVINSNADLASDGKYVIDVCQTGTSVCDSSNNYFTIVTGETYTPNTY